MPPYAQYPLDFSKGLYRQDEPTVIPNGTLFNVENWEAGPTGGLRVKTSWAHGSSGFGTSGNHPKCLGMQYHPTMVDSSGEQGLIVYADDSTSRYDIYALGTVTPEVFALLGNIPVTTTGTTLLMAIGRANLIVYGIMLQKLYRIEANGLIIASTGGVPQYSLALCLHLDAYWAGGGTDMAGNSDPDLLMWTNPAAISTDPWPVTNSVRIGTGDNDEIRGLISFQDVLVVGKRRGIWTVNGVPPNLDIHKLVMGEVSRGRPLVPTDYGLACISPMAVYLFDGGASINRISDPIADLYAPGNWVDGAFFDNKLFVTSDGSPMYVYDFPSQTWTIEDPDDTRNRPNKIVSREGVMWGAPRDSISLHPTFDRKLFDRSGDLATQFTLTAQTPEYWVGGPTNPTTFRHLELLLRQRNADVGKSLSVTTTIRQEDGSISTDQQTVEPVGPSPEANPPVWRTRLDLQGSGFAISFAFSQTVPPGQSLAFDIERAVLLHVPGPER